jgi:hypothetical protein
VNSKTLWIALAADNIGGCKPLINGSDTVTGTPYVLTVTAGAGDLTTSKMDRKAGTVVHRQM